MGRDQAQQASDRISAAASSPEMSSSSSGKQVTSLQKQEQRHVLPKDLPNAVKKLSNEELDRLLSAVLEETRRRGKSASNVQRDEVAPRSPSKQKVKEAALSLTRGQVSAVRAALKAGVKPSAIFRQFGISQSDIRKGWSQRVDATLYL